MNYHKVESTHQEYGDPLYSEMISMISDSYTEVDKALTRNFNESDAVYLARDSQGQLAGFFFYRVQNLEINGEDVPSIYTGLTCVRRNQRGKGIVHGLFAMFKKEWAQTGSDHLTRIVCWGTTASPIMYKVVHEQFADVEPRPDGHYTDWGKAVALSVRKTKGWSGTPLDYPFLIQGGVSTRYSEQERKRIKVLRERVGIRLFEDLHIDELNGDRLLLVFRIPEPVSSVT